MLSISHAVTGAFIAVKIGNPVLAFPLIILSHYLEDSIHHWDVGTGISGGTKSSALAFRHELFDLTLAAVLVLIFFPLSSYNLSSLIYSLKEPQIWGALLGILPDLLEAPRNFWKYEPVWLSPINRFHGRFHHSFPQIIPGLAPQVILLPLLWFLR